MLIFYFQNDCGGRVGFRFTQTLFQIQNQKLCIKAMKKSDVICRQCRCLNTEIKVYSRANDMSRPTLSLLYVVPSLVVITPHRLNCSYLPPTDLGFLYKRVCVIPTYWDCCTV